MASAFFCFLVMLYNETYFLYRQIRNNAGFNQ